MSAYKMIAIVLITFTGGLVLLGIGLKIYMMLQIKRINKNWKEKEYILEGEEKKALVLYQPSKHHTADRFNRLLAEALQKKGYEVTVNYLSCKEKYKIENYDIISLGSPVYMGRISSFIMEYLEEKRPVKKKIIFFITGMIPDSTKEFKEIKEKTEKENQVFCCKAVINEPEEVEKFVDRIIEKEKIGRDF